MLLRTGDAQALRRRLHIQHPCNIWDLRIGDSSLTWLYNPKFLPLGKSRVVIDMKTVGSNAWKNQILAKGPHKDYFIQLTIYVHILDCDYGVIAYENKDNSKMMWFQVPRNDEWWEIIQYQSKMMIEMSKSRKLPPPKYSSKACYSCKWCEFRELCHKSKVWEDPNLEKKRREFYKSLL